MGLGGAGGDGGPGSPDAMGDHGGAGGHANGWLFGIGGHGGDGGPGGHGGDGGDALGLLSSGGAGGAAGDGVGAYGLPALGGAGGDGGTLGHHGAVGAAGMLPGGPPTNSATTLSTAGDWFINSDGQVVTLHGFNEVLKVPPNAPVAGGFSDDDAAFLAANGFNAVRVGIFWSAIEPQPGVFNDAYLASIQQTVQTLADHHIYAILAMHQDAWGPSFAGDGAPSWATLEAGGPPSPVQQLILAALGPLAGQSPERVAELTGSLPAWDAFWSNTPASDGVGLENHYAQMLQYVADYFKGDSNVAGYSMFSEPWPGGPQNPFGGPNFDAEQLTPFYNQAASAIRSVDPNTPLFFEPSIAYYFGQPLTLGNVDATNTVVNYDMFCPMPDALVGALCPGWDNYFMDGIKGYGQEHGIPAFLMSFGATDNNEKIDIMMNAADQHQIGWLYWTYSHGELGNTLINDPSLPPTGDNVVADKLLTLASPYAQLVSGTPQSWSFSDGVFQLSYSTEMANGSGEFAAGSQTTISVPSIQYPSGYHVDVTGGHVISAPNTSQLVVASDGSASTVTVSVSAAGADGGAGAG
jgi:endoglycosylceramidase